MPERLELAPPRPPVGFVDRVMARIDRAEAARRRRRRAWAAGGALLVAAAAVAALWLVRAPEPRVAAPGRLTHGTVVLEGEARVVETELGRVTTQGRDGHVVVRAGNARDTMKRVAQGAAGAAALGAVITIYVLSGEASVQLVEGPPLHLKAGDRALLSHGAPPLVVPGAAPGVPEPVARAGGAGDREPPPDDLQGALAMWLRSRQGQVYACWHEAKARGAAPEGAFLVRATADAEGGRARVTGTLVAGDKATPGDARFIDCVALAVENLALAVPPGHASATADVPMVLGDAVDLVDDDWRRQHGLDEAAAVVPEDVDREPTAFVDPGDSPSMGPKDAPVTIIEFSDFQCPFCAAGAMTMHKVVLAYGDKVRFVFKNKPLPVHDKAGLAAQAAAAAHEQGKFWEMHDLIFSNQDKIDRASIDEYARLIGLDMDRYRRALDEGKFADIIAADAAVADELGVKGVPTFVINGRVVQGSRPYEAFQAIIDEELAKTRQP
jgi:protein-disulfide isomerase